MDSKQHFKLPIHVSHKDGLINVLDDLKLKYEIEPGENYAHFNIEFNHPIEVYHVGFYFRAKLKQ